MPIDPNQWTPPPSDGASDILWGASQIAAELNCSVRRAFYLCEKNLIPCRKVSMPSG